MSATNGTSHRGYVHGVRNDGASRDMCIVRLALRRCGRQRGGVIQLEIAKRLMTADDARP